MAKDDVTDFPISTGQIAAAIRLLPRSSTTAADVAKIWLDILEIFFPDSEGFERFNAYSTPDRVLIEVQRTKDLDGDVIFDDSDRKSFLAIDCRPHGAAGCDSQFVSSEYEGGDDGPFCFGVVCVGAHAVFLKDVTSSQVHQEMLSMYGVKTGSANLIKASGRDMTENWLRKIRDSCDIWTGASW